MFELQAHSCNDTLALRRIAHSQATVVEIDAVLTADGVLVASHEPVVTAAECGPTSLAGLPWSRLTEEQARGCGRISLAEAVAAARGRAIVVDAKCFPPLTASARTFALALQPFLRSVSVASFSRELLAAVRELEPSAPTVALYDWEFDGLDAGAAAIGPRASLVTGALVAEAHEYGLRVIPWTVNDPDELRRLVTLGVDGIVTDDPFAMHDAYALIADAEASEEANVGG